MPKRPSDSESDGRESLYANSPKRSRTVDSDDDGDDLEVPNSTNRNGRARARFANDEELEVDMENEEEEEQFEEEHREQIMAELESKRKIQGGIADHGIIERIEMHNFMCHKYLTFDFGPQINFIIGHNGSGKSAVLSAITVALGGKSNSTGRGTGLKSFIKEGQSVAEVTITLKNQGDEAYKPKEYGKSVIVTRRFSKEGQASWKIKNEKGVVLHTKKEELSAICDHMNIQVDNPLNVLTQDLTRFALDSARQFLSASHATDKYKFFLRGTQLSQLSEEYETCLSNIKQTSQVLTQKKAAIPDLKIAFDDATDRFREAAKAREQKQKADELKKELAWAHVKGKQIEMENKTHAVVKLKTRLPRIQKGIDEANAAFEAATQEVALYETQVEEVGDLEELNRERDRLQRLIRDNKKLIADFNSDCKTMEQSSNLVDKQIEELDKKIATETKRMEANTQAKHDETQRRLEGAKNDVDAAQSEQERIAAEIRDLEASADAVKKEGEDSNKSLEAIKAEIANCQGMIQRAKDAEKNNLIPYGNNIKAVLEEIKKSNWIGDPPVGPMGLYVKAKDPKTWGNLLRNQLSGYLTGFVLTNGNDRDNLKRILSKYGNHHTTIIISEKDIFDYSSGEPPREYLTVLRALEISDPFVLRVLINQVRIERQLLAQRRDEGERTLKQLHGGGTAWTTDWFIVKVYPEGGSASTPITQHKRNDATNLLLTGRDAVSEVRHHEDQIKTLQPRFNAVTSDQQRLRGEYAAIRKNVDDLKKQHARANEKFRRAKTILANLQQEANDDMPTNISSFQSAKEEAEAEKRNVVEQIVDVLRQKREVDEKNKLLLPSLDRVKQRIAEFNEQKSALVAKAQDAVERRLKAQTARDHYQQKLESENKAINDAQAVVDVLEEEFLNWSAKAREYCEEVPNPRDADTVKRNLESVQKALQERERRHGASVEEMTIEVNKAKAKLETAEREWKQMHNLNKALRASLVVRLEKWQEFRRHIALRCKYVFAYNLSHRGYYGKVLFNHVAGTLVLKVQTDDQASKQQTSREKDARSLSGGEKSFSTICLLLSLWESIGCPLRCLDEFDVFMDAVNRRISMKMMVRAITFGIIRFSLIAPISS
ncbi:hypothetical protein H0H81_002847 [Sphagnurus paluster]|uniref:RecF/RecN/SMC N-terminal domain-containing protein n=1 Tax=Sphagnurus paluster TaxID=117069 RepID=A0A9P7FT69_9AGAR|nr:hypothetical protein H0H81_002847 [Sphagnurus paluster]